MTAGILRCSPTDWALFGVPLFNAVVLLIAALLVVRKSINRKIRANYPIVEGDFKFNFQTIGKVSIYSFFAGFQEAAFGVGQGLVIDPFFLNCGLDPVTVAATEVHLAFYATLTSTAVVIIFGLLNFPYALVSLFMALIGSIIGINLQNYMVEKTGRPSLITWCLAFITLFCLVLIPISAFPRIALAAS